MHPARVVKISDELSRIGLLAKYPAAAQLYIHLISKADINGGTDFYRGECVEVRPGQIITCVQKLADDLHLTPAKIKRALQFLADERLIDVDASRRFTRISVQNFSYEPDALHC